MAFDLVIQNTSEVLRVDGAPNAPAEEALAPIPGGAVGVSDGRIAFLGPRAALPTDAIGAQTRVIDAGGGFVGPGFVDPHTHLVFAGDRSKEFDLRNRGATYLEIAQAGGGIANTVKATRAASEDELLALALPRARRLLEQGVTCAEVKSGYGLDLESELKMLRVIRRLGEAQPIALLPTLLCAHAIPEEYKGRRDEYVRLCIDEIIPAVAEQQLARFCDAFVEQSAFTIEEGRAILSAAKARGLLPRLHADQLTAGGGSRLAAELGATSADHLEQVNDEGIAALVKANVSAVLVPMSTFYLRIRGYAPGRKLRDAGLNVALATNVNPGSAMSENLGVTLSLACLENGLSAAEAYYGFTRGAALALGLEDRGLLREGGRADLVVFGCESFRHLPYHLGVNHARTVVVGGRVEVDAALPAAPCV